MQGVGKLTTIRETAAVVTNQNNDHSHPRAQQLIVLDSLEIPRREERQT